MNIRRALRQDYKYFVEIEKQYEGFPQWSENSFCKEENNAYSVTLTAEKDEVVCGFINFWMLRPEVQLNLIAVEKKFLRNKTATELLKKMREYAKKSLCKNIVLEVNVNNDAAIKFYEKCGFIVVGRRTKFYNDKDDALLMKADV